MSREHGCVRNVTSLTEDRFQPYIWKNDVKQSFSAESSGKHDGDGTQPDVAMSLPSREKALRPTT